MKRLFTTQLYNFRSSKNKCKVVCVILSTILSLSLVVLIVVGAAIQLDASLEPSDEPVTVSPSIQRFPVVPPVDSPPSLSDASSTILSLQSEIHSLKDKLKQYERERNERNRQIEPPVDEGRSTQNDVGGRQEEVDDDIPPLVELPSPPNSPPRHPSVLDNAVPPFTYDSLTPYDLLQLSNMTVLYDFGAGGCSGWAIECINIIRGIAPFLGKPSWLVDINNVDGVDEDDNNVILMRKILQWASMNDIDLSAYGYGQLGVIVGNDICPGLPSSTTQLLENLRRNAEQMAHLHNRGERVIDLFISHKPPQRYPTFPYNGLVRVTQRPRFVVGRSMAETSRIRSDWAKAATSGYYVETKDYSKVYFPTVDEIWVPSQHSFGSFASSGINEDIMYVLSEPVDTDFYSPSRSSPYLHHDVRANVITHLGIHNTYNPSHFNFLSLFKWEARKNWKGLLQGFLDAFNPPIFDKNGETIEKTVHLYIITYVFGMTPAQSSAAIERDMDSWLENEYEHVGHRDDEGNNVQIDVSNIHIITTSLQSYEMAAMYSLFDAFVLPTHGEGWGLPVMEAMAMGLPSITTRYSGMVEFCDDTNSFLVDVEGMEQAKGGEEFNEGGLLWARPDISHLTQLMRTLVESPSVARRIGKKASDDMLKKFNIETVGTEFLIHMRRVQEKMELMQAENQ